MSRSPITNRCHTRDPSSNISKFRISKEVETEGNSDNEQNRYDMQYRLNPTPNINIAIINKHIESECKNRSKCIINTRKNN